MPEAQTLFEAQVEGDRIGGYLEKVFADSDFRALPRNLQVSWLRDNPNLGGKLDERELGDLISAFSVSGWRGPEGGQLGIVPKPVQRAAHAVLDPALGAISLMGAGASELVGAERTAGRLRNLTRVLGEQSEEAVEPYSRAARLASEVGGGLLGSLPAVMAGGPVLGLAALSGLSQYGADPTDPGRAAKEGLKGALLGTVWKRVEPLSRLARGAALGATAGALAVERGVNRRRPDLNQGEQPGLSSDEEKQFQADYARVARRLGLGALDDDPEARERYVDAWRAARSWQRAAAQ